VAWSRCLHDADGTDFEPSRYLLDLALAEQACHPWNMATNTLAQAGDRRLPAPGAA
jgi:hypothetical protein